MATSLVVLAGILAACSGDEVELREPNPGALPGGVLTVAIAEPHSIDPPAVSALDAAGTAVVEVLCDRLIELDPRTGEPVPAIAESWIVSDGGRQLTVKIRKGVRFHNGRELLADDVVFSLSRIADRDFASPSASIMESVAGYQQVHGNEEVDEERFRKQLRGLEAIEKYSFEVQLTQNQSEFVRALAHVATSIVPKAAVEADPDAFARRPVCAGPYRMMASWAPGDESIRVERFDNYYGANTAYTAGGRGYADSIEFKIGSDGAAQVAAVQQAAVDVANVSEDSEFATNGGDAVVTARTSTLEYIGLPTNHAPFDIRGVRIAFSRALDRGAVVDSVYRGLRQPATGFLLPSLGGVSREGACGKQAPATADVEGARRLLQEAEVDLQGQTLRFYFNDEFGHRQLAEAVTRQWNAAFGVEFELVGMPWESYIAKGVAQAGFDGPFRMSFSPTYVSAERYLQPLFESSSIGQNNVTKFSSRDFDRSLDRGARRAIDEEDLRQELQSLEDLLCGEMPLIPLDYGTRVYAVNHARLACAVDTCTSGPTGLILLRELYARQS